MGAADRGGRVVKYKFRIKQTENTGSDRERETRYGKVPDHIKNISETAVGRIGGCSSCTGRPDGDPDCRELEYNLHERRRNELCYC